MNKKQDIALRVGAGILVAGISVVISPEPATTGWMLVGFGFGIIVGALFFSARNYLELIE